MRTLPTIAILLTIGLGGCEPATMTIEGIDQNLGVIQGGETVTIRGDGMSTTSPVSVYFGDQKSRAVSVKGTRLIHATTPATEVEGPVDVLIIAADGTQFRITGGFEYVRQNRMAECVNIGRALNGKPPGDK